RRRCEGGAGPGTGGGVSRLPPRGAPGTPPPAPTGLARVRAPWNAKAGKAGGALDRRVSFFRVCSGAPHPSLWGEREKRRALPRPHQVRDPHSVGYAFFIFRTARGGCGKAHQTTPVTLRRERRSHLPAPEPSQVGLGRLAHS